jgi:hypothetical protein
VKGKKIVFIFAINFIRGSILFPPAAARAAFSIDSPTHTLLQGN